MPLPRALRHAAYAALSLGLTAPVGLALIGFNDGHDKIYVHGMVSTGWSSNTSATRDGHSDSITHLELGADYERRAGLIAVDAKVAVDSSYYAQYTDENTVEPRASLELTKADGRTTGSWTLSAARQDRNDSAANRRVESWNYETGLNLRYPVISRYSLAGGVDYSRQVITESNLGLVNVESCSANADLFYEYTSDRDLFAGIRVRHDQTSGRLTGNDYAAYVGISGKVLPKINGTLRLGYQERHEDGYRAPSWTSATSLTWSPTKKLRLIGHLNKDYSTTTTDGSCDTLTGGVDASYAFTAKFAAFAGAYAGHSRFLDRQLVDGRTDDFWGANIGVQYTRNEHLKISLTYGFHENSSTLAIANYRSHSVSLAVSSRF